MNAESHPTDGTRPAGADDGGSVDHAAEPLPCADCGARAQIERYPRLVIVQCTGCDANSTYCESEAEAVETWNHRPEPDAAVSSLTAERDRLREKAQALVDAVGDEVRERRLGDVPADCVSSKTYAAAAALAHELNPEPPETAPRQAASPVSTTPAPDAPAEDAETHA